jgi:hypothetical protein
MQFPSFRRAKFAQVRSCIPSLDSYGKVETAAAGGFDYLLVFAFFR